MAASTTATGSTRLHVESQLAGDDAGDVEQVLDELRLGVGVALDDLQRPLGRRRVEDARSRSMRAQPRIAFSGVRSSCESVARNSSFSVLAASASARAACCRS